MSDFEATSKNFKFATKLNNSYSGETRELRVINGVRMRKNGCVDSLHITNTEREITDSYERQSHQTRCCKILTHETNTRCHQKYKHSMTR